MYDCLNMKFYELALTFVFSSSVRFRVRLKLPGPEFCYPTKTPQPPVGALGWLRECGWQLGRGVS